MARDFDGSTDRIDFANIWNSAGQAQTISFWTYPGSVATNQYFWTSLGDGQVTGAVGTFPGTGAVSFFVSTDNTNLSRRSDAAQIATGSQQHILLTWDGSLTAANVHIYVGGTEVSGYQTTTDGVGNFDAADGEHSIGGRIADDLRNYDGRLAGFGWWNRVLGAGEIVSLAKGYSPRFIPNGLQAAPDLLRSLIDPISGKVGTADGTTVIAHPRIIYPSKIWVPHIVVAVGVTVPIMTYHYKQAGGL